MGIRQQYKLIDRYIRKLMNSQKNFYASAFIFSHPPKRRRVTYASTIRPASV